jgi:hypothetical protein
MIQETINLLGHRASDLVTGYKGVISSVSFDLYGRVQVAISPPADRPELKSGHWFDVHRLKVEKEKVMTAPSFDAVTTVAEFKHGPADKPAPR